MVVLIQKDDSNTTRRIIIITIISIIAIVGAILLWIYVISPRLGDIFPSDNGNGDGVACTSPPTIPTGLILSVSGNSASASWPQNDNTDSYVLYVSPVNDFQIGFAERTIPITGTNTVVPNLLPIEYYFKLTAINSCGESNPSNQVSRLVTQWPSKIKVCKKDMPTLCLLLPQTATQNARVSLTCPNNECEINYLAEERISLFPGGNFCLEEAPGVGMPVEEVVTSELCTVGLNQLWAINIDTGRISSNGGYSLGADNVVESFAYNSDNTLITPGDPRYEWVVQPIT